MAESKTRDDQTDSQNGEAHSTAANEQKKWHRMRKSKKIAEKSIDEMKISGLKDALGRMNLSTTGNKAQLQIRLQNARVRRRVSEIETNHESDRDEENADDEEATRATDDEGMTDNEATSNEED